MKLIENLERKLEYTADCKQVTESNSLLLNPRLLRVFILVGLIWTVNDYFYIAGTLNAENLVGNIFINFALVSLTELPSVFIGQFLMDRYGRRWVHCGCMILATIPMFLCSFLVNFNQQAVMVLTLVSKAASNVGWFIMWVQSMEIFPTSLRSTGITISATFASFICMSGPFVVDLGKVDSSYPFIVFTCIGSLGILFTSFVPETLGTPISADVSDTLKLVKKFKYFQLKTW